MHIALEVQRLRPDVISILNHLFEVQRLMLSDISIKSHITIICLMQIALEAQRPMLEKLNIINDMVVDFVI